MEATTDHLELILTGIGLIVVWASSLISFWVRINVKLKELDMMITNTRQNVSDRFIHNEETLESHIKWGENQQMLNDVRFKELINENKIEHKDLASKLDCLINSFNDFRVDVAKGKI